uniref:Uncharacterized protein n=1 Tax=Rhizophora mucronata TaxID=61149 RepID=A0A2P2QG46_RHIMU
MPEKVPVFLLLFRYFLLFLWYAYFG